MSELRGWIWMSLASRGCGILRPWEGLFSESFQKVGNKAWKKVLAGSWYVHGRSSLLGSLPIVNKNSSYTWCFFLMQKQQQLKTRNEEKLNRPVCASRSPSFSATTAKPSYIPTPLLRFPCSLCGFTWGNDSPTTHIDVAGALCLLLPGVFIWLGAGRLLW